MPNLKLDHTQRSKNSIMFSIVKYRQLFPQPKRHPDVIKEIGLSTYLAQNTRGEEKEEAAEEAGAEAVVEAVAVAEDVVEAADMGADTLPTMLTIQTIGNPN